MDRAFCLALSRRTPSVDDFRDRRRQLFAYNLTFRRSDNEHCMNILLFRPKLVRVNFALQWNSLIRFPRRGLCAERMWGRSEFNSHFYAALLKDCIRNDDLIGATGLHCEILKRGGCLDLFSYNILLHMYTKSGLFIDARKLFDELPERNTVSFVTLINGCSESRRFLEAVELFARLHGEGHELNPFVFTTILKLLVGMERGDLCWTLHSCIYKLGHASNAFVGTALIDAYSVCGEVDLAKEVFGVIDSKDMVSWTGMMTCYAENGCFAEALDIYSDMRVAGFKPNNFTFSTLLKACLGLRDFNAGRAVHGCALKMCYEQDLFVGVALLELYTNFGFTDDAKQCFENMPKNDVIPWSFMIARFSQSSQCEEAVDLFCRMMQAFVEPNQYTYSSVLQACATMEALDLGRQVHSHVLKVGFASDVFVSNALMDVYAKCACMANTMDLFESSPNRNEVSWNTVIVGYVQSGDGEKALSLFQSMLGCQVQATEVTYSSVLRACATLAALELGFQIHSLTIKTFYDQDLVVGNALIDMYAKCGSIRDARLVFDWLNEQDDVSWNAMISGYSMHGLAMEALKMFELMQKKECRPNKLTFVGVLSACSNGGLLDRGQHYFYSMLQDYGIEPCIEHYTCMVWLFGRLGLLDKAVKLIEEIPFKPSVMVWRALLGACVIHNNVELGRISAQHILEMKPQDEATHVLLSNIFANARRWESVSWIRKRMKKKGVKKEPGLSWIENQGEVHKFGVGDSSHPDMKLINGMLEFLNMKSRKEGYKANLDAILLAVEDDKKERLLWVHSERLAIAFGLIRIPLGCPIRVIKNLRICVDCHAATKLISKIMHRDIILRDMNRFHHFQNGSCSCGDYW